MKYLLPLYTIMHFLVDFACIFRLFVYVQPQVSGIQNWVFLVVLYNFLAFALPALIGLISDFLNKNYLLGGIGCALVGLSGLVIFPTYIPVILAGIGNGLFHVGIGRQILNDSKNSFIPSGVFICSGAMGVFLGTFWNKGHIHPADYILTGLMLLSACGLIVLGIKKQMSWMFKESEKNENCHHEKYTGSSRTSAFLTVPALLLFIVVFLRSFYGHAGSYGWKNTYLIGLVFTACIAGGKCLGGIMAERLGVRRTSVLSLAGAAVCVLFSAESVFWGCLSILLFNMSMPLTLTLLAHYWKNWPGFAFGMLMLALFLGGVPGYFLGEVLLPVYGLSLVSIGSMVLLLLATVREKKKHHGT